MRKFISLVVGLLIGGGLGALLITLFSPVSADEFRANLKEHYDRALEAGRKASAKRRAELEQELQSLREKDTQAES